MNRNSSQSSHWQIARSVFFFYLLQAGMIPSAESAAVTPSFTNLAERLLQSQLNIALTQIQVHPTNEYGPAVHRLLQVAANICDASTNSLYPSVFRPRFSASDTNGNVFISGYYQDNDVNTVNDWLETNPYGTPMVIGAKKGFPNFNEVSLVTTVQVRRKLELTRPNTNFGTRPNETNQMYDLYISNLFGVETWNSYSTNTYPGGTYTRYARTYHRFAVAKRDKCVPITVRDHRRSLRKNSGTTSPALAT